MQTTPKSSHTEEFYRQIYESSADAVMTLEPPDWKFTSGNPATIRMFNVKDEEEFISLEPWKLSPEKQPDGQMSSEKAKKMIEKAMKDGSNFFEWTHKKYNGEDFPATVLLSKVEEAGKSYLQATVRDISKEKQVNENNRILSAIIDSSEDAILSKDLNGVILTWNKGAENLYGYSSQEIVGKNVNILLPPDRKDEINQIFEKIKKGERVGHIETVRVKKDGTNIDVDLTVSPIFDWTGKIIGASSIALDISSRKEIEKELKQRIDETEQMNKLMVGRELKMIELKERIRELERGSVVVNKESNVSWKDKFKEGEDIEEIFVIKIKEPYFNQINKSQLPDVIKEECKKLLQVLIDDSTRHLALLKQMEEEQING